MCVLIRSINSLRVRKHIQDICHTPNSYKGQVPNMHTCMCHKLYSYKFQIEVPKCSADHNQKSPMFKCLKQRNHNQEVCIAHVDNGWLQESNCTKSIVDKIHIFNCFLESSPFLLCIAVQKRLLASGQVVKVKLLEVYKVCKDEASGQQKEGGVEEGKTASFPQIYSLNAAGHYHHTQTQALLVLQKIQTLILKYHLKKKERNQPNF